MNYLFFDTETTGLPQSWHAPVEDVDNWPRLVQLAYILCDENGCEIKIGSYIIRPEGFAIPKESSNIHGITTKRALEEGAPLKQVLLEFQDLIDQSNCLVAHNISFDEKIIGAEFLRNGMSDCTAFKSRICTKEAATDFCAIPSANGFSSYKWPKLSELHQKLFGSDFQDAHNALADVTVTAKCFFEMKRLKVL